MEHPSTSGELHGIPEQRIEHGLIGESIDKAKGGPNSVLASAWIIAILSGSFLFACAVAGFLFSVYCADHMSDDGTLLSQIRASYQACVLFPVRTYLYQIRHEWFYSFIQPFINPYVYLVISGILLLEWLIPSQIGQRIFSAGLFQDFLWFVTNRLLNIVLFAGGFVWLYTFYQEHLAFLTIQLIQTWPISLKLVTVVVLADFLSWLHHYLRHKVWLFWCFHTVHHSQRQMNPFTDDRVHVVEPIIATLVTVLPSYMLGLEAPMNFYVAFVLAWYPKIYHANLKTNFGPLKYFLVTPQSHRIHHSMQEQHRDRNFGVIFTVWDRMFGTLYPRYDEYPETGIPDERFPLEQDIKGVKILRNYLAQLAYPFVVMYRGRTARSGT